MVKLLDPSNASEPRHQKGRRRLVAVATLPTLLTLGNLLCGLAAIYCSLLAIQSDSGQVASLAEHGELFQRMLSTYLTIGAFLLFVAMICDALDL